MNLAVDGREFVQLTSPKFACVVVSPGRHTLSAAFGGLAGPQSKGANLEFEAIEGGVALVRITANMGLVQGAVRFTPESDLAAAKGCASSGCQWLRRIRGDMIPSRDGDSRQVSRQTAIGVA